MPLSTSFNPSEGRSLSRLPQNTLDRGDGHSIHLSALGDRHAVSYQDANTRKLRPRDLAYRPWFGADPRLYIVVTDWRRRRHFRYRGLRVGRSAAPGCGWTCWSSARCDRHAENIRAVRGTTVAAAVSLIITLLSPGLTIHLCRNLPSLEWRTSKDYKNPENLGPRMSRRKSRSVVKRISPSVAGRRWQSA
jgi:hypothetical protein